MALMPPAEEGSGGEYLAPRVGECGGDGNETKLCWEIDPGPERNDDAFGLAGEGLVTTTSMNGLSGSREAKEDDDWIGRSAVEPCMSDPRWEEEPLSGEVCGEAKGFCRFSSAAGDLGKGGKFSMKTEPPRVCRGVVC